MTDATALHQRLDLLGEKLNNVKATREAKAGWHDGHAATNAELSERYREVRARVEEQVTHDEDLGKHVSKLEYAMREWLEDLNYDAG